MKKYLFFLLAFFLLCLLCIPNLIAKKNLDNNIIKNLLIQNAAKEGKECKPININHELGSFTGKTAFEAIISFSDQVQCHAEGFQEIWLLDYDKNWRIREKILDCDDVTFKLVDIEDDGRDELWLTCTHCAQGCRYYGYLVSLNVNSIDTLYSNYGHNWGLQNYEIGECVECSSKVEFWDVNNDKILEILETQYRTILESKKENGPFLDPSKCTTSSVTIKSVYKKINNKFGLISSDTL